MNIGNASMKPFENNLTIHVQSPNAYVFFEIHGETVASLKCRNHLLLDDPNKYGLDMCHNDLANVHFFNCSNSIVVNLCTTNASFNRAFVENVIIGENALFTKTCFTNISIVNFFGRYCCY